MDNDIVINTSDTDRDLHLAGYRRHLKSGGYIKKDGMNRYHILIRSFKYKKKKAAYIHYDLTIKKSPREYEHMSIPMPDLLGKEKDRIESLIKP